METRSAAREFAESAQPIPPPAERPWAKLPVAIRARLHELSGAELKVWLCYLLHANRKGVAWPGRKLLGRETGLCDDWISRARTKLAEKGWLSRVGVCRRGDGTLTGSLLFRVIVPYASDAEQCAAPEKVGHRTIPGTGQSWATDAELFPTTDAEENRARSRTTEEDPSKQRDGAQPEKQASQGEHGTTLSASRSIRRTARTSPDPRHTPIITAYVEEYERHHPPLRAPVEASDHKQLAGLLRRQPLAALEAINGWLRNAFDSDDTPPLRRGFRLREFCSHAEKYANGPLRRAAGATWVRSRDRSTKEIKEISDAPNKFDGIQPIA